MTNEQYLIISYLFVGAVCVVLALATHALLRHSFTVLTKAMPSNRLGAVLRRLFFLGLFLPAMAGFFSVSFRSCSKKTYEDIIADRYFLVLKNQEQLSASLSHISVALLVWGFIVLAGIIFVRTKERGVP
jgi:hypothetical protein